MGPAIVGMGSILGKVVYIVLFIYFSYKVWTSVGKFQRQGDKTFTAQLTTVDPFYHKYFFHIHIELGQGNGHLTHGMNSTSLMNNTGRISYKKVNVANLKV